MKKSGLVLALLLSSTTVFASDVYDCTVSPQSYTDFGSAFTVTLGSHSIRISNFDGKGTDVKKISGEIDRNYHPRSQNKGSLRYNTVVSGGAYATGCDEAEVYLNPAMASGRNGRLTIAYDCDSDGSGPLFEVYVCRR